MSTRDQEALRPKITAVILGKTYEDIVRFSVTQTLTNIYDGWQLDVPNLDKRHVQFITQELHRWTPITLYHSDPLVNGGQPRPCLQGVITGLDSAFGDQPSTITLTGYDLGKLLDCDGPPWTPITGNTWQHLLDKVIHPSWRTVPGGGATSWGIQGARSGYCSGRIRQGRYGEVRDYGRRMLQFMPGLQIEPGEKIYDTLSRYARLAARDNGSSGGSFVRCSADGWIEIFNPDDRLSEAAPYTLNLVKDKRNGRFVRGRLNLNGDSLANEYEVFGSIIRQFFAKDQRDQNAGKIHKRVISSQPLRVFRRKTTTDAERYNSQFCAARAEWMRKQAEYMAWSMTLELQGHSIPGRDGKYIPVVEGDAMEIVDEYNDLRDSYLIDAVTWTQDAQSGTKSQVTLRKRGLLSA